MVFKIGVTILREGAGKQEDGQVLWKCDTVKATGSNVMKN
jgi:hypothetical protein